LLERKTYKADIDRLRPRLFVGAFLGVTLSFFLALQWRSYDVTSALLDDALNDVSVDMEMLSNLKPEQNVIAAVKKPKESTDRINKVDEVVEEKMLEDIKEQIHFTPSEADGADQLKASEVEPISPIITDMDNNEVPLRIVEQLPEFPGGMTEFMRWLTHALKYPLRASQQKQMGEVMVSFVVEKDGSISNVRFVKQTHTSLDAEVLRVLRIMPKWTPGQNKGKPCRSVVAVPFVFAL